MADELRVPGLSPDAPPPKLTLPPCEMTGDANSCARFLACVGNDGLWIDGQARGFNQGTLSGQRSDGVVCAGQWAYGSLLGSATASFECADGLTGQLIYYSQDGETGTGIARGVDSLRRGVRAWTGQNVLQYLGDGDVNAAELPCSETPIPIS